MNLFQELTLRPPQSRVRGTIVAGCTLGPSLDPRKPSNAKRGGNGETRRAIADFMAGKTGISTEELAERFDLHPTSITYALGQLRDEGLVCMTGAGGRQRWNSTLK